jgi:flagellar FliL protein
MALNLFKKKAKGEPAAEPAEGEAAQAEGAEGAAEGAEGDKKKKGPPLKLVIIGAAAGLVLVGGGGASYLIFLKKPPAAEAAGAHKEKPKKKKKEGGEGEGAAKAPGPNDPVVSDGPNGVVFYTLPDLVVNMQTAEGKATYLKLKLTLELPDHDTVDVLEPNRPRLNDMFTSFLRELRPEDLSGSQGSYQLRMELLRRVNLVIAPAKINAVLIQEMLIT